MKKLIRMFALVLALITVTGMFAACATTKDPEETTEGPATVDTPAAGDVIEDPAVTEEETLYAPDDLDERYNFDTTITIFLWDDYRMTEFYADENGDIINDAVYHRNIRVGDRLGVTFEFVEQPGDSGDYKTWIQSAENDRAADNSFDIYAGYSRSLPLMSLKGMTTNLLSHENFSVEKPWWPEALTSECTINDKLFFCTGDIATSMLWYMNGFMYNKDLYAQYISTEKTPLDMVLEDEWDMNSFFTMVQDIYIDDGNGKKDKLDFFGATMYSTDIDAFQIGAGITSLEKTEDGGVRVSEQWNSQRCADICELLGSYIQQPGVFAATSDSRHPFLNETSIFHLDRIFLIKGIDNGSSEEKVEFTCGVVPAPKYDKTQEKYHTNLGNPYTMYGVNSSSKNLDAAVTTLEAMGSENYRSVTPAVFEVAMKVRYTDDPQTSQVFDILKEGVSFDFGKLYSSSFGDAPANLFKETAMSTNPSGLLSKLKAMQRLIDKGIKEVQKAYAD
ncbi:MAG: hypothetical protein J6S71_06020 [Clostridia bacterium]|nr:hypothetical protein [Clostridia bacterium]